MTISEAAAQVLTEKGAAMHASKIADEIASRSLYTFGTKDPAGVVSQALRKQCASAEKPGVFVKTGPNTFALSQE